MADDLARLSRKLLSAGLAKDGGPVLSHDDYFERTKALPPALRDQVVSLMAGLRETIPNDFAFSLACEVAGARLTIEFEDGDTFSSAGGGFFTSQKSMTAKLRRINWDERRGEAIKTSEHFEKTIGEAEDRPANIPSSEEAARRYGDDLEAALEGVRAECPIRDFALIVGNEEEGVSVSDYSLRPDVIGEIANAMTCGYDILAVLERGVARPWAEIEAAKREAVERLGPISRAKAERRF